MVVSSDTKILCFFPLFCDFRFDGDTSNYRETLEDRLLCFFGVVSYSHWQQNLMINPRIDKSGGLDAGNRILLVACISILHMSQCQKKENRECRSAGTPSEAVLNSNG